MGPRRANTDASARPTSAPVAAHRTQRPGPRSLPPDFPVCIAADVPDVWAGSEQPNRHAVGMPSLQSALFVGQISELLLGSGPRGRRFKSSRPDQFLRKPAESRLPGPSFLSRIPFAEPSGRCFKSGLHAESFEISRLRRSRTGPSLERFQAKSYPQRYPTPRPTLND